MGLMTSLAGFIDNEGLAEAFAEKPEDSTKIRRPLLDGIARTREQFASRDGDAVKDAVKGGSRWWQIQNNVVAFTVKIGGGVLTLNDAATNHIPVAVFAAFLDTFEQAVNAGELDEALKAKDAERARARKAPGGARERGVAAGDRHPSNDRADWDGLAWGERQRINALYRSGRNPDGSVIAVSGYLPDAPLRA